MNIIVAKYNITSITDKSFHLPINNVSNGHEYDT